MKLRVVFGAALFAAACGGPSGRDDARKKHTPVPLEPAVAVEPERLLDPVPPAGPVLITGAEILTAAGQVYPSGWIRLRDGRIAALGEGDAPAAEDGERVFDAAGLHVTPGLIDAHSHLGVYAAPGVWANADGNEMTHPVTAGVRAEEAFWPQDPGIQRAVAGGVTSALIVPGSGNLMGGHGVAIKLHPRRDARSMRFPGAKDALKMACGENPKAVYGREKHTAPMSRMGSIAMMREKWIAARRYKQRWDEWRANPTEDKDGDEVPRTPPDRDLTLETLVGVLDGQILPQIHCYRADEMLVQIKLADEFGFQIRAFHHAVEAYKIRDVLAARKIGVATWADWWGFKIEAWDGIEQNLALLAESGVRAIAHSDSAEGIQRLNQEAAKAYHAGRHSGVQVTQNDALRWITANPAWVLGVEDQTGTLEVGKMADVVVWDGHPLSVYGKARWVFIDGHLRYDATTPDAAPWSDFEVGR